MLLMMITEIDAKLFTSKIPEMVAQLEEDNREPRLDLTKSFEVGATEMAEEDKKGMLEVEIEVRQGCQQ